MCNLTSSLRETNASKSGGGETGHDSSRASSQANSFETRYTAVSYEGGLTRYPCGPSSGSVLQETTPHPSRPPPPSFPTVWCWYCHQCQHHLRPKSPRLRVVVASHRSSPWRQHQHQRRCCPHLKPLAALALWRFHFGRADK